MLRFQAPGLRLNSALPSSLLLLLFLLTFTWVLHRCARMKAALPGATYLELSILFGVSKVLPTFVFFQAFVFRNNIMF
jgi:uncharacterized membrane protein (DUF485 family)